MGQIEPLAVGREGERPAFRQGVRGFERAGLVEPRMQLGFRDRRLADPPGDELARPQGVIGPADDELGLGEAGAIERQFQGEARGRVERPELAFIVELPPTPALAAGGLISDPSPRNRVRESS